MSHFAAVKSSLPVAAADAKNPLLCPKPRRLCPADPVRPLRCHQPDPRSGVDLDLLDLLLSKEEERPFMCGSPPRRVSNPVVHDSRFGVDCPPVPAWPAAAARPLPSAQPLDAPRATGCARAKFGFQPAAVRIEGFDCLDRDRRGRGHGIAAVA